MVFLGKRCLRYTILTVAVGLLAYGPVAAQAARSGAVPDPAFADGGIARLSAEPSFSVYGAATQGGELLVGGGSGVQVLNDSGAAGEGFGGTGSINLPSTSGREMVIDAITVDAQGRLIVVGTAYFSESENPSPPLENGTRAFRPATVRILRFLPDGQLDPSFGQEGAVESDLGLPPPLGTKGERLGPHPAVVPNGVAVDPEGRIVVTGYAIVHLGQSCVHDSFAPVGVGAGFLARFTESGAPDLSFGTNGLVGGRKSSENRLGATSIADPVIAPDGVITYLGFGGGNCEGGRSRSGIGQLTVGGRVRMAFGKKGAMLGRFRALAGEPDGSLTALAEPPRGPKQIVAGRLVRIGPGGRIDRSYGKDGEASVMAGSGFGTTIDSLAVDGRGRAIVGGTLGGAKGRSILLLRVSAGGRWERSFGPHGRVSTRVAGLSQFGASALFFDPRGRLDTVLQYTEEREGRSGLVVARYLLGS